MALFFAGVTLRPAPRPALRWYQPQCCATAMSDAEEARAITLCEEWIEAHVIRLGLCPYAAKPFAAENIRYAVSPAADDEELIDDFFLEGRILLDAPADELATTMLIAPHYAGSIDEFSWLYNWLVDTLEDPDETLLSNGVQPAFFHPDWSFSELPAESPLHFEKRAPIPVVNLLRRADLNRVVQAGIEQGVVVNKQIAEHNAAALEAEGVDAMAAVFARLLQQHQYQS